jgi:hypothetical protein
MGSLGRWLYDRFVDRCEENGSFRGVFAIDGCWTWDGMVIASVDTISHSGLYFDGL